MSKTMPRCDDKVVAACPFENCVLVFTRSGEVIKVTHKPTGPATAGFTVERILRLFHE